VTGLVRADRLIGPNKPELCDITDADLMDSRGFVAGSILNVGEDLSAARYELEAFLLRGDFDLSEDGRLIGMVGPGKAAAEVSFGKLLFSCWSDEWSKVWRVTAGEIEPNRLTLRCTRQMGRVTCLLELRRGPAPVELTKSRADFAENLVRLIEANLAGIEVEHSTTARDGQRHLSGSHVRLVLKDAGFAQAGVTAGIATASVEFQAVVDATLGAGLAWLDALRRSRRLVRGLIMFLPAGRSATVATRVTMLRAGDPAVSLYEVSEQDKTTTAVTPFDQGDLADNLRRAAARAIWPRERGFAGAASDLVDDVVRLAPDLIDARQMGSAIVLSIRGLEFARVLVKHRRVVFGLENDKKTLKDQNRSELARLVNDIGLLRTTLSDDRNGLIYRAQSERWLESAVRREATVIEPNIDPRFVYSQVPTYRGEQRTFIDLLGITRAGRLVIMELKVAEDPDFPLQALDYWLRVDWHRRRGDFQRRGYFRGVEIADAAPLLYLVAPLFRFHATTGLLGGSISERVPVYRIGINEDWRSGIRVLLRERLNAG
jgi:hypothetical protein